MRFAAVVPLLLLLLLAAPPAALPAGSPLKGRFEEVATDSDVTLHRVILFASGAVRACGADGMVLRSADGKDWQTTQVKEEVSLRAMAFSDENRGIVAGRLKTKNFLFTTRDGGKSFTEIAVDLPAPIAGLAFRDANNGWLVAGSEKTKDGLWRLTTDGGRTWSERDSVAYRLPARKLNEIHGFSADFLVAVGGHVSVNLVGEGARSLLYQRRAGGVLRTLDGGQTWEVQDAGNPEGTELSDVDFIDAKTGYVVGDAGFAARTTDGGQTWKKLPTGVTGRLLAVDAITAESAFFAGEAGTALATNDGGATFNVLATGTEKDLRDVSMKDDKTGYVVGQGGTILRFVREW